MHQSAICILHHAIYIMYWCTRVFIIYCTVGSFDDHAHHGKEYLISIVGELGLKSCKPVHILFLCRLSSWFMLVCVVQGPLGFVLCRLYYPNKKPNHACLFLVSDLCTINSCLLKRAAFAYACKLLTESHMPNLFCSAAPIASSTHIWYAIDSKTERVWLVRLTYLSDKSKSHSNTNLW